MLLAAQSQTALQAVALSRFLTERGRTYVINSFHKQPKSLGYYRISISNMPHFNYTAKRHQRSLKNENLLIYKQLYNSVDLPFLSCRQIVDSFRRFSCCSGGILRENFSSGKITLRIEAIFWPVFLS